MTTIILLLCNVFLLAFGIALLSSIEFEYYLLFLISVGVSIVLLSLTPIIYMIPMLPMTSDGKIDFNLTKDYTWIINEQRKPTTKRYKLRKILLVVLFPLGILSFIANIIFLIIGDLVL